MAVAVGFVEACAIRDGPVDVPAAAIDVASIDAALVGLPNALLGWPGPSELDGAARVATPPRTKSSATTIVTFCRRDAARHALPTVVMELFPPSSGAPAIKRVEFGPSPVLEIEDVATLDPHGFPDNGERTGVWIRVGRANPDRISLSHRLDAYRFDNEVAKLLSLIRRSEEIRVGRVERDEDVEVAIGFVTDRLDGAGHADAGRLDRESRGVVDVAVLVGWLARR
jgi:hypothetical protein